VVDLSNCNLPINTTSSGKTTYIIFKKKFYCVIQTFLCKLVFQTAFLINDRIVLS
jgi:hypothetical protein